MEYIDNWKWNHNKTRTEHNDMNTLHGILYIQMKIWFKGIVEN